MKVLIADDEPIARQVLRELLEEIPGVTIAGEAATGASALELAGRCSPDLLLLDIHMPGADGLAVARALRGSPLPLIIYVTAFQQHALDAFDSGAVDYLLKPVRKERLEAALAKAHTQLAGLKPAPPIEPRRYPARSGADIHLIPVDDIVAFLADGDSARILTTSARFESDQTLKALEQTFPPPRFRRIHRSMIVNSDHIRRISPLSSKRFLLTLSGGIEATVSKRMAGAIRDTTRW